jgi:hypothetical protein
MLRLGTVRFRAKCQRHPRYNPALEGEGAIKGGCPKCQLLLEIFHAHRQMVTLMRKVKDVPQKKGSGAPADSGAQMDLFATPQH